MVIVAMDQSIYAEHSVQQCNAAAYGYKKDEHVESFCPSCGAL